MSASETNSHDFSNVERVLDVIPPPNQAYKKKLVFRKDGGKLMILERPSNLEKDQNSCLLSDKSEIDDHLICEVIPIKQEYACEIDDGVETLFNESDSIDVLDFRLNEQSEKLYAFVCEICGLKFKGHNALASHRKWKHLNIIKHECEYCGRSFRDSFCLKRHLKKVHTSDGNIRENFRALQCFLCPFQASEGSLVSKHYGTAHGYDMSEERLSFPSFKEFNIWKKEIESKTKSKFVKTRGARVNRNGTIATQYNCHRSGYYNSTVKNKRIRSLKSSGSNKINGFCPASISCIEFKGQIIVKYVITHVGHNLDVKKLGLTEDEKEFIADKLMNKVPMDRILEDLTESVPNPSDKKRINLTTRKDFYNIIQKFNLKELAVYSQFKDEWSKFDSFVEELKTKSNIVRFYKPLGKLSKEYSEFKSEDFFLIIASDEQLEMLRHYANNCICVDNVFKVNINDFELYTIMILDEIRESFPCVFIFSSRVDDNALRVYFNIIKSYLDCELCPRHFVSDWANSIYNAWTSVFTEVPGRNMFTCSHIEREWKKNLCKIKTKEKQDEVLGKIKCLLDLSNFVDFEEQSKLIMKELSYNYETKFYSNYLQKFFSEPHSWAPCYRLNGEINKSLNVGDLYSHIEYFLVKNKKVKCLTKTAEALIHYATTKFLQRSSEQFQQIFQEKMSSIVARHLAALELQESMVEITEQGWNVTTVTDDMKQNHLVFKDDFDCTCHLICPDCSVCTHAYSCTCSDATEEFNMCLHIHLIVTCLKNDMLSEKEEYCADERIIEVEVTTSAINLEDEAAANNTTVLDCQENQIEHEKPNSDINKKENDAQKAIIRLETKKCEFINRLTTLVKKVESEEESDSTYPKNSPLGELLHNIKEQKATVLVEGIDECAETLFYRNEKSFLTVQDKDTQSYQDNYVGEAEQIALEVILES